MGFVLQVVYFFGWLGFSCLFLPEILLYTSGSHGKNLIQVN